MIIGFLGKGGSGKTTLATLYTKYLLNDNNFTDFESVDFKGNQVMALDNDHNMDFKFNLGHEGDMNYMGQSLKEIFEAVNINNTKEVIDVEEEHIFSLNPIDNLTNKYTTKLIDKESGKEYRLMVSGPHTQDIMYGNMCSHALTAPLKVYLPFLKLGDNEYVIVDEKAGTDGVGTGVTTGFNIAIVVAEATAHGIKAAKQIIGMLEFYKTPYIVAINKIRDSDDAVSLEKQLDLKEGILVTHFRYNSDALDLKVNDDNKKEFDIIYKYIKNVEDDRRKRTETRILKQKEYNSRLV